MLALYAMRISLARSSGKALAVVSTGAPLGFAFGTPLGAFIGTTSDWRWSFIGLSALAALVALAVVFVVPDAAGQPAGAPASLLRVLRLPGVLVVLVVILIWMLAHNTIYTYVAPYLRATATSITPDLMLLVYGLASLGGIAVTGALLDRFPRALLHLSIALSILAGVILLVGHDSTPAVLIAAALWGLTFGGASAQLQSALTRVGREHADVANSFLPVAFNVAIFAAGILGAVLLGPFDGLVLAVVMVGLGAVALAVTIYGRRSAFTG